MNHILTTYDWVYGIAQFAAVILSIIAGALAAHLFTAARKRKTLVAWRFLTIALLLFALEEILGFLAAFDIFTTPYLTHIVPSFILGLLIAALAIQITISKGCVQ